MQTILVKDILNVTSGRLIYGAESRVIRQFSLDSRTIKPQDMFIAVKGKRFDGHRFLGEAVKKGASGLICEERYVFTEPLLHLLNGRLNKGLIIIKVRNTIDALGSISGIYRSRFSGPVISLTGSVGKTTTKDIIACVLSQKFSVHKTHGTLNNHIGVPITLMDLDRQFDVSVVEMGMSGPGEIRRLAEITQPDAGIITNIGPAHLEGLGSIENIVKAKAELLDVLGPQALAVLNGDDNYYLQLKNHIKSRLITIGTGGNSDFQAVSIAIGLDNALSFKIIARPFNEVLGIKMPVVGLHNVYSALIASAVGYGLGLKAEEIINGLAGVELPPMRMEIHKLGDNIRIIDDCYNANPVSMNSALDTLSRLEARGKKIFVCGDMAELGEYSAGFHKELGRKIAGKKIDSLITIGRLSSKYVSAVAVEGGINHNSVYNCKNNIEAVEVLAHWLEPGDTVLIKGSRSNHMEEIVKGIKDCYAALDQLIA